MRAIVIGRPGSFRVAGVPDLSDTVDGAVAEFVAVPAVNACLLRAPRGIKWHIRPS